MTTLAAIELAGISLALSSIVWVLGIQAIGLLRSMPRPKFLGLQMRLVRIWVSALAGITAIVGALALARGGLAHAWPIIAAFVVALGSARWVIPRALRSGGEAVRTDEGAPMTAGGFLADGGGQATRVMHRVVLVMTVVVIAGLGWSARTLLRGAAQPRREAAPAAQHAEIDRGGVGARVLIDPVTADNIARLERAAAAVLAGGGAGDVAGLRSDWDRIVEQCTTQGDAHARLHGFLGPVAGALERVEATTGPQRRDAVRALLRVLGQFDAGFTAAS